MDIFRTICAFGILLAVVVNFVVSVIKYRKCPWKCVAEKMKRRNEMILTGLVSLLLGIGIAFLMAQIGASLNEVYGD